MINTILNLFNNVSIKNNIKFADKSYKYDTLYFAVSIINSHLDKTNNTFKTDEISKIKMIQQFTTLLNLKKEQSALAANSNYLSESLQFLREAMVINQIDKTTYKVINKDIFDFIGMCMETSYIFQYLLAYKLFKNDDIWNLYVDFCNTIDIGRKSEKLFKITEKIQMLLEHKKWVKFQTKFFINVLGLANEQNYVSRTLNIQEKIISPDDLANRAGTRSSTIKDNQYSDKFKLETVQNYLKDYLAFNFKAKGINIEPLVRYTVNPLPDNLLQIKNELNSIDDETNKGNEITQEIIKRNEELIAKSANDDQSVNKINFENLKQQVIKASRKRDKFIAELSKKNANYLDEFDNTTSFEGKDGKNYVESHHIIEFNTELGPDISLNLICLNPLHHSLIHHGSKKAVRDFFKECRRKNVITLNRFENMCIKYQCLTKKHVEILLDKCLINEEESIHLYNLINIFGSSNAPKNI